MSDSADTLTYSVAPLANKLSSSRYSQDHAADVHNLEMLTFLSSSSPAKANCLVVNAVLDKRDERPFFSK